MYKIGILERDTAYLKRLTGFLRERHNSSFEIDILDIDEIGNIDFGMADYHAIFLGDGIDTETENGIPQEIMQAYITEKEDTDTRHINRYQSLEKIYQGMLRVCREGEKPTEAEEALPVGNDFKPETVTVEDETYRVYHIEEERIDMIAVKMLLANHIPGIPQTQYSDGELRVRVTGMRSLYDKVQGDNTPEGKLELLKIFDSLISNALGLEEYMLSSDRLVLHPREIYLDEAAGEAVMPYIPVKGGETKNIRQCLEEIRTLCDVLLEGLCGKVQPLAVGKTEQEMPGSNEYATDEHVTEQKVDAKLPDEAGSYEAAPTDVFEDLQKNAKDSLKLKKETSALSRKKLPYLVRRRTGEKILINRNIFKLGKDGTYVDYCIRDNPTVSRNHADIVRRQDGYYLVDKGSLNHSFVDGKKLEADEYRKLENGCLMQLADEVFEFVTDKEIKIEEL